MEASKNIDSKIPLAVCSEQLPISLTNKKNWRLIRIEKNVYTIDLLYCEYITSMIDTFFVRFPESNLLIRYAGLLPGIKNIISQLENYGLEVGFVENDIVEGINLEKIYVTLNQKSLETSKHLFCKLLRNYVELHMAIVDQDRIGALFNTWSSDKSDVIDCVKFCLVLEESNLLIEFDDDSLLVIESK